jgi:hypothetical protein
MRCWIAALIALCACGPKEHMEPEPPWVTDYQRIAREGCECQDPDCLDAAHAAAVKMETEHGGIDEAPPSVQTAHGELDQCWREGTADIGRDLADAADAVCRCTDDACIEHYRVQVVQIEDKYGTDTHGGGLDAGAKAEVDRADACLAAVTIDATEYLTAMTAATTALCKCEDPECVVTELSRDPRSFGDRFYLAEAASIETPLADLSAKYCECYKIAKTKVLKDQDKNSQSQLPPTKLVLDMGCKLVK